ncbi:hypothetical protein IPJ72_02900 [Candidatus Peregrinibacteria bacterium]|nr:MAG: hypothetical protein IPJ72_02900 [Candidatus Peregrinibacteria bacterium]
MKSFIKKLGLLLTAFYLSPMFALAQGTVGRSATTLTPPLGGDQLPGGTLLPTNDIKTSFLFSGIIPFVIRYAIGLAAALAVIALIFAGYQFMTAYGNQERRDEAIKTIQWALLGLVIVIVSFGVVSVISRIQLTPSNAS